MTRRVSHPLLKRLRREATANPKKAGLLGLLLLVAAYFWAPLLRQWISTLENAPETSTAAAAPAVDVPPTTAANAPTPSLANMPAPAPPKFHWRHLAQAIETDPQMRSAAPTAEPGAQRDPFVDPRPPVVAQAVPDPEPVRDDLTPGELGLVLSSTIVGESRRTAVINGKIYVPGRELEASDGMVFVVSRIEPWGIVLERAGKQFELELPRPSSAAH